MSVKLTIKDKGYKKLMKRLGAKGVSLTVGIHEKDNIAYERGQGASATTANIGSFHEYGTQKMPKRPWLEPVIKAGRDRYLRSVALIEQAYLLDKISDVQRKTMIGVVGEKIVSDIITHIKKGDFAPLAQSTINARLNEDKASITILIDTAQMVQSIGHEVHDKK